MDLNNNTHFNTMIEHLELDCDLNKNCQNINNKLIEKTSYLMWQGCQTFVELPKTKMKNITKIWDILVGTSFKNNYINNNINNKQIILFNNEYKPYYQSVTFQENINGEIFEVCQAINFKMSLCKSRIFDINIDNEFICANDIIFNKHINLFNRVNNKVLLRIVCTLLYEPNISYNILKILLKDIGFDKNGYNKEVFNEIEFISLLDRSWSDNFYKVNKINIDNSWINNGHINDTLTYINNVMLNVINMKVDAQFRDKMNPKYLGKPLEYIIDAIKSNNKILDSVILDMFKNDSNIKLGLSKLIKYNDRSGLTRLICGIFVELCQYRSNIFIQNNELFNYIISLLLPLIGANNSIIVKYGKKTMEKMIEYLYNNMDLSIFYSHFFVKLLNIFNNKSTVWLHQNKGKSSESFINTFELIVNKLIELNKIYVPTKIVTEIKEDNETDIPNIISKIYSDLLKLFISTEKDTYQSKYGITRTSSFNLLNLLVNFHNDTIFNSIKLGTKAQSKYKSKLKTLNPSNNKSSKNKSKKSSKKSKSKSKRKRKGGIKELRQQYMKRKNIKNDLECKSPETLKQ